MRRMHRWVTLGLLGVVGWFASSSPGAEIRNRVGDRDIVRTASSQDTGAGNGAGGAALPGADSPGDSGQGSGGTGLSNSDETTRLRPSMDGPLMEAPMSGPYDDHGLATDTFDGGCMACGTPGCNMDCFVSCGRWVKVDYLLWWRKGRSVPPLAITSTDTNDLNNLRLGLDSTEVIFGGTTIGEDARPGGRITLGTWLDEAEYHGIEGRYWQLGNEEITFSASSDGDIPLGRPITDATVDPAQATSRTLAFPQFNSDGVINISSTSEVLGGDVLYRRLIGCGTSNRLYVLGGYQYARIDEDLLISDSTFILASATTQAITDHFATQNRYNAGSIGLAYEYYGNCWSMDLLAKVAFGTMSQQVTISGSTTNNGIPVEPPIGLLAIDNQGTFSRDKFAVSPELGVNFAWQLTDCLDLSIGYSYIYWNSVVQPEDQIPVGAGGPIVPSNFTFNDGSYWVHGLSLGGEWRF